MYHITTLEQYRRYSDCFIAQDKKILNSVDSLNFKSNKQSIGRLFFDDVMTKKHCPHQFLFVRRVNRPSVDFPLKGPRMRSHCGSFSLTQTIKQTVELLVIWDATTTLMCDITIMQSFQGKHDVEACWPMYTLQWRHNERDGVSNHQPHDYLLKDLFRRRSKNTSKK